MGSSKHVVTVVLGILGLSCAVGSVLAAKRPAYRAAIDPADFKEGVDHPYFPLTPGTKYVFAERSGKHVSENEITVTHDTKTIMGVRCIVVHDVVREEGVVKEETYDWYAQHKDGTVWYFGEDTKEFGPRGTVSTEGSWEAGVKGAQAGVFMPARIEPGKPFYQEYYRGHAEDMAQIAAVNDRVTVPFGSFGGCIRTKEWSMLEAGTEKKWYARGVGRVRAESAAKEVEELISVTRP